MADGPSTARSRHPDGPDVFVADEQGDVPVDGAHLGRLACEVLRAERVRVNAELGLYFVDEEAMADLNQRFMGDPDATDVLAFPIEEVGEVGRSPDSGTTGPDRGHSDVPDMPMLLGDVFVCPVVAARNAAERSIPVEDELALLVVHGVLHVLGMDHADDEEAAIMQQREREHLSRFHTSP